MYHQIQRPDQDMPVAKTHKQKNSHPVHIETRVVRQKDDRTTVAVATIIDYYDTAVLWSGLYYLVRVPQLPNNLAVQRGQKYWSTL